MTQLYQIRCTTATCSWLFLGGQKFTQEEAEVYCKMLNWLNKDRYQNAAVVPVEYETEPKR